MVVTSERFLMLLLFGFSTMVNACGWISIAPIFSLVEDVSSHDIILSICICSALRRWPIDGQLHVIFLHGLIPADELPMRVCS